MSGTAQKKKTSLSLVIALDILTMRLKQDKTKRIKLEDGSAHGLVQLTRFTGMKEQGCVLI